MIYGILIIWVTSFVCFTHHSACDHLQGQQQTVPQIQGYLILLDVKIWQKNHFDQLALHRAWFNNISGFDHLGISKQ